VNAMRGLATEFGLTVPKGISRLGELTALVDADEAFPETARGVFTELHEQCDSLVEGIDTIETKIVAHARNDETARRLATSAADAFRHIGSLRDPIPGIGPITASLIAATVADISVFKSARHFAAWLGLVPRQYSTGGKTRLGRITKTGNREIRRLLVLGATSMVYRAEQWNSVVGAWTRGVLQRRPVRLVTVALANKMARIAWALMTRQEVYQAKGRIAATAEVAA
jgi:transposase